MQFTSQFEQGDWYVLAAWTCVVAALLTYGVTVLARRMRDWLASRRPARGMTPKPALAAGGRRAHAGLQVLKTPVGRAASRRREPGPRHDWSRMRDIVEVGIRKAEDIVSWQACARDQIDAAEYELGRLVRECGRVMSVAFAETIAAQQAPRPATPALAREPLAA
jgi:hypothetical protein